MTLITKGLKIVKEAMVNFAKSVVAAITAVGHLFEAAAKGVYHFFKGLFGVGPPPTGGDCPGCVTPWQWWLMGQDPTDCFFIRVLENQDSGIGLAESDQTAGNQIELAAKSYKWTDDTQWWFVSLLDDNACLYV